MSSIPGGRSLRPVKNRGGFVKVVGQNFLFFTGQSKSLTKLPLRKRKKPKRGRGRELEFESGGTLGQKWGKSCTILTPDLGDKSHWIH